MFPRAAGASSLVRRREVVPPSDVGDGDLDLDARLDGDRGDLFHDVRRGVQVDEALVNAHLPAVERVGALAARRLAHAEPQRERDADAVQALLLRLEGLHFGLHGWPTSVNGAPR